MPAEYKINQTQSYAYQDETGRLVNGFRVWFTMTQFHETHEIRVPSLDPAIVSAAIMPLIENRKKLAAL